MNRRVNPPGGATVSTRWRKMRGWIAGGASFALIATIAVVASGYDAQETPREEPSVWVTREAGQYARVNTETGELDLVRKVSEPSSVLQSGATSVVLTHGNGRAWPVDSASPADLGDESPAAAAGDDVGDDSGADADAATASLDGGSGDTEDDAGAGAESEEGNAAGAVRMPEGTRDIISAGDHVLIRTEAGAVYLGELGAGASTGAGVGAVAQSTELVAARLTSLRQLDPLAGDARSGDSAEDSANGAADQTDSSDVTNSAGYRADAVAISDSGLIAMYSASDGSIARYDAVRGTFTSGIERLPEAAQGLAEAQLALVAGDWVLLDAESGTLWREGASAVQLDIVGASKLQASTRGATAGAAGGDVLVADVAGLWRVPSGADAVRIVEADGTPAQPSEVGGVRFAAWAGQNGGELWASDTEETTTLDFDESASDLGEVEPVFRSNGSRAVLSEVRTGMIWTLPEGRLIPLSQWSISDPPKEDRGTVVVEEVTEQVAPTAVPDEFGVRQGEQTSLPVLLNDFDSNKRDVLTIVPESLGESPLPESFGTVELAADAQSLTVHPAVGASGTAAFSYRLTDGALVSELATVTLTVASDEINSAPAWCPVAGCQREWAVPAIAPGGTLVYPILEGWVDAEGDPMLLIGAELLRPEDPARAIVTADGRLAVRHTDANAGASEIMLRLTVRDGRGEERQRELQIAVQPNAAAEFSPVAAAVQVDRATTLRPLERVAGGSGSFVLTDAVVQSGSDRIKVAAQPSGGAIEVTASEAGDAIVAIGIRDTVTGAEITGLMRVTATPGTPALTLPPLRAFVRPLADSTVEVLNAIPGAAGRALSVQAVTVVDGDLRAEAVEHALVRVAGSTADGTAGRIGAVDITVTDGGAQTQGRLTVFQVPENSESGAIAVADSAIVRAGSVVDIRVLDNDVSAPGERLILHPEVTGSGAEGELAFASGSVLRYLSPETPGTYRVSYTTYGASTPEASDVGTVTITVLPTGANRDPLPQTLTVRVAPGEQAEVQVPLSGVDPDGDRVRLIGVGQVDDPQLTASLTATGAGLAVSASGSASPGVYTVAYSVRDDAGGTANGTLRIIVTAGDAGGAPIAASDYARLVLGGSTPVVILPLDNDIDPARGTLELVSVEPNVPGGAASPDYERLAARLDLSRMSEGVVTALPGDELGTVSYRYTVRSSASSSTSDGLILVQTSERVGAQAPAITDTVLNVRDRTDLTESGVDVVTDKVRWTAGDARTLELSLWQGSGSGYRVSGSRILGDYDPDGDLVVFRLSGVDATGAEVSSYGFLVIPPLDELRVTLKPGLAALSVDENKTVEAGIRSLVDLSPGDRVELRQASFSVGRAQAKCEAIGAETIRYTAGGEAPWNDTCLIEVRLVGQKSWTALPVPVSIVPRAPIVQLSAVTRTVAPGGTESIDLTDMIKWQGDRAGDVSKLRFEVAGGGSLFQVQRSGNSVRVDARADATTGSQEVVTVTVSGAGDSRASLTLRVGEAPKDKPRGATVKLVCTVGSNCAIDVIGAAGEYDPFAGKTGGGLKLETVSGSACTFGTVSRAGDRGVTVSWPDSRGPGGKCTVGFTVRDAQGRAGEGSIEFDAQGVPRAPTISRVESFTGNSVTLAVTLASPSSHPAVTEVRLSGAGSSSCTPSGATGYRCVVTNLENGAEHNFTAQAVNSAGASDPSGSMRAWAYQVPATPTITEAKSVADAGVTQARGMVQFSLTGGSDVAGYRVTIGGDAFELAGRTQSDVRRAAPVGSQQIQVVALSRFTPPIDGALDANRATRNIVVAGAPTSGTAMLTSPESRTITAQMSGAGANFADAAGQELRYAFLLDRRNPAACPPLGDAAYGENSATFEGLQRYSRYQVRACVSNGFGIAEATGAIRTGSGGGGEVPQPSGSLSYSVGPAAAIAGNRADYALTTSPTPTYAFDEGATLQYRVGGTIRSDFTLDERYVQPVEVRQCFDVDDEESCSAWLTISWSGAPTLVRVQLTGVCVDPADPRAAVQISDAAFSSATVTAAADGSVTVTWSGQFAGLEPVTLLGTACAVPEPEPEPEPGDP